MINDTNKLKCLSLFSGCGGMDLGALGGFTFQGKKYSRLDTNIVFANDIDCNAVTCYNSNPLLSKVLMYLYEDVCKMNPSALFSGIDTKGRLHYSDVCAVFDEKGIEIFGADFELKAENAND